MGSINWKETKQLQSPGRKKSSKLVTLKNYNARLKKFKKTPKTKLNSKEVKGSYSKAPTPWEQEHSPPRRAALPGASPGRPLVSAAAITNSPKCLA